MEYGANGFGIWRKWFWNMAQMVLEYGAFQAMSVVGIYSIL